MGITNRIVYSLIVAAALFSACNSPFDDPTDLGRDIVESVDPSLTNLGRVVAVLTDSVPVTGTFSLVYNRNTLLQRTGDPDTTVFDSLLGGNRINIRYINLRNSIDWTTYATGLMGSHVGRNPMRVGTDPVLGDSSFGYLEFPLSSIDDTAARVIEVDSIVDSMWLVVPYDTSSNPGKFSAFALTSPKRFNAAIDQNYSDTLVQVDSGNGSTGVVRFRFPSRTVRAFGTALTAAFRDRAISEDALGIVLWKDAPGLTSVQFGGPTTNSAHIVIKYRENLPFQFRDTLVARLGDITVRDPNPTETNAQPVMAWQQGRQAVYELDLTDVLDTVEALGGQFSSVSHIRVNLESLRGSQGELIYSLVPSTQFSEDSILSIPRYRTRRIVLRGNDTTQFVNLPVTEYLNEFIRSGNRSSRYRLVLALVNSSAQWTRALWTSPTHLKLETVLYIRND